MTSFKILDVHANHHKRPGYRSLTVDVVFETEEVQKYGALLEYRRAIVVQDPQAVEDHYARLTKVLEDEGKTILDEFVPDPSRPGFKVFKPTHPSPYDLGLMSSGWTLGSEALWWADDNHEKPIREGPGRFRFRSVVADCLVTRAALWQIAEMKDEMERGFCRYGDYPDQAGAFRSGSPEQDFSILLETLHSLWD